jgi:hypothetical protein
MNARNERVRPGSPVRRIVTVVLLGGIVFVALWLMAFSLVTSLLVAAGFGVVVVAASTVSDLVELVLDAVVAAVFAVLAAIAAVFAAIFSLFGF